MKNQADILLGFEDLSVDQISHQLFGHLEPGDRVAITTRQYDDNAKAYVAALKGRGLQVRVIQGQEDIEDFCFLSRTQKELVGNARSTYVLWAAFLGQMTKARLYTVDSRGLRLRFGPYFREMFRYNFSSPKLQYIEFPMYRSELLNQVTKSALT